MRLAFFCFLDALEVLAFLVVLVFLDLLEVQSYDFCRSRPKDMSKKIPHLAWKVWEMAVLRQALGLCGEIACLRMCAHRDVERHVARMARETLHQSSEGCHRVENEIGRLCLAHKDATLRVVGRVAHVDENRLKTWYVA